MAGADLNHRGTETQRRDVFDNFVFLPSSVSMCLCVSVVTLLFSLLTGA